MSKHSDASNYREHIRVEWRKFLRHAGKMPDDRMFLTWHGHHILAPPFSHDDQYGNDIDGLTISLEPARAG